MKKETSSVGKAVGVGIAALAAAAAGAYYLYGSDSAKEHRKSIKSWALRVKADVMDEIQEMKEVNEAAYREVVAKVGKKYKDIKGMDQDELAALVARLQGHWNDIKGEIEMAGRDTGHTAKKVARKTVKEVRS
jgi:uncharacterized protein (DUF305 family)